MDNIKTWTGSRYGRVSQDDKKQIYMEKVRPWCGQPSDRRRLKNRTELFDKIAKCLHFVSAVVSYKGSHFSKLMLKIIRCGGSLSITLIGLLRRICFPVLLNFDQRLLELW